MRWLESHEEDISDISPPELILILENNPGSTWFSKEKIYKS